MWTVGAGRRCWRTRATSRRRRRALLEGFPSLPVLLASLDDPASEVVAHPVSSNLVQPGGQADAAGNGIQFRDAESVLRDEQIGADDARHFVLERRRALQRDQFGGFALVEPARDPFGLFAFDALAVEQVDRAIELQQHAPERFDLFGQRWRRAEGDRRDPPLVAGEQALRGQLVADKARAVRGASRKRSVELSLPCQVRTWPVPMPSHL